MDTQTRSDSYTYIYMYTNIYIYIYIYKHTHTHTQNHKHINIQAYHIYKQRKQNPNTFCRRVLSFVHTLRLEGMGWLRSAGSIKL